MNNSTNKIVLENWEKNRSTMGVPKSINDIYAIKDLGTGKYIPKEEIKEDEFERLCSLESEGKILIFT